jgi:heme/copper-type cytochrome/quinol oxidase subunit 2
MPGKRNIVLWYVISFITLWIGWVVWYYKINADAKRLAKNDSWSPGMSVVAVTIGALIIIPPFVSVWRTWSRVREATHAEGMSSGLQFVLCFVPIVSVAYAGYLQSKLNNAVGEPMAAPAPAQAP